MRKNPPAKKAAKTITRPSYALDSVDNALRLLQMLRDVGALRLKDAAEELGTAPSTAHRLLAMLVYRGFAVQDEKRRYHPGPAMGVGPAQQGWTRELTDICRPHMDALSTSTGETANLVIRIGSQVRFLYSAESESMLRVGDRQGQVLPAERTAVGGFCWPSCRGRHLSSSTYSPTPIQARTRRPVSSSIDDWRRASSSPSAVSSRRPGRSASRSTSSRRRPVWPLSVSPCATAAGRPSPR